MEEKDIEFTTLTDADCAGIRQVQMELLKQFGRICSNWSIPYFVGPELSQYFLKEKETIPVSHKTKLYLKFDDYYKFCSKVSASLDYQKFFWCYETVTHKEPFLKGFFSKNATQLTCLENDNGVKHRISLEVICLYPYPKNKFILATQKSCMFIYRNLRSPLRVMVEKGNVFTYKLTRFLYQSAQNMFLFLARKTKRKDGFIDYSEVHVCKKGILCKEDWFSNCRQIDLNGVSVPVPKGYQELAAELESLPHVPYLVSMPVKFFQEQVPKATGKQRRLQMIENELLLEVDRICRKHNLHYAVLGGTLIGALRHKGFIPWDDDIDVSLERKEYEILMKVMPAELDQEKYFLQTIDTDTYYYNTWARLHRKGTVFAEASQQLLDVRKGIRIDILPYDHIHKNALIASGIQFAIARLKTIMWSNKGKIVSKSKFWRCAYRILSHIPKKWAYNRIIDLCMFSEKHRGKAGYFININKFEYTQGFCALDYDNPVTLEFEGHDIMTFGNWHLYIQYFGDFMSLPPVEEREAHSPAVVDVGELYQEMEGEHK